MLYPVFLRLERSGAIASRWVDPSGRRRKSYRGTRDGRRQLADERRQWRTVDAALPKIRPDRSECAAWASGRAGLIQAASGR